MDTLISLGADLLIFPIALLAAYALLFKIKNEDKYHAYVMVIMAGLTAYLMAKLIGSVYQPADVRPFELMGLEPGASYLDNPGFPSDHALFGAFLAFAVLGAARQVKLAAFLGVLVILMSVGRVLALVHTPLDIIGGITIAAFGALWYLQPYKQTIAKKAKS